MSAEIDEAARRLIAIQDEVERQLGEEINEATTRFRVLDRVLVEVLGWSHGNITTELAVENGFVDYTLHAPDGRALCVIEAKRAGRLQLGTASSKTSDLALTGVTLKPLSAPIRQTINYASLKGVPVACLTDGRSWLFFQTNRRDGKSLLDGKGIFFPSLQAVTSDFPRFHDLLSPGGFKDRLGQVQLNRAEGIAASGEESQSAVAPPEQAQMHPRGALGQDALLLFQQFFSNITSDSDHEMLTACFVETPESRKADVELQKIAQKLLNNIQQLDTSSSAALQEHIERAIQMMTSETVLLVGNKGAGKTTFISRFFSHILSPEIAKSSVLLRVGLENYSDTDHLRLPSWIVRQLRDQAERAVSSGDRATYDELRGVFWSEYVRQRDGSHYHLYRKDPDAFRIQFGDYLERMREEDPEQYLLAFLNRAVANERRLPCIVYDNADGFPPLVQDAVFQLANSISNRCPVLNIVPITDRTVWRLSRDGALKSYSAQSFYLPVPESKQILRKRIEYVKDKLNDSQDFAKQYFTSKGFKVSLENIDRFAVAVERLFVSNEFVSGTIGRLANFNIRRMLDIARRVFMSPEISIDDVLTGSFGLNPGSSEINRIHRALVKGEYDRYSERENEFILNLFWTDPVSPSSPLLAYYILWILRQRMISARSDSVDSRHWSIGDICSYFEAAGTRSEQTVLLINRLRERGLLDSLDPNIMGLGPLDRIAITDSGIAHIDLAISSDVYLEEMSMTTGLNSNDVYARIKFARESGSAKQLNLARSIFVDYLVELDTARTSLPPTVEYDPLREARRRIRGQGGVKTDRPTPAPKTQERTSPAESIGTPLRPSRWRRGT
ncbi:MAG: hypothetical protein Q7V15_13090 [Phenylobacterium sp.]|uniref:hypothetical protein n=1 Tax=Phenylobacterium sp. TaxID=1871053 RepID=UPI0027187ED9|nr:hypothetical protein [Phenylobacterium sp.]MDO8902275.1 hypothetical protein [Phenylobacterium sp.]